jgi:hypothetical protein
VQVGESVKLVAQTAEMCSDVCQQWARGVGMVR